MGPAPGSSLRSLSSESVHIAATHVTSVAASPTRGVSRVVHVTCDSLRARLFVPPSRGLQNAHRRSHSLSISDSAVTDVLHAFAHLLQQRCLPLPN